jgi:hypothetical protein
MKMPLPKPPYPRMTLQIFAGPASSGSSMAPGIDCAPRPRGYAGQERSI